MLRLSSLEEIREDRGCRGKFLLVDMGQAFDILALYMARIFSLRRKPTLALRQRRQRLIQLLKVYPDSLRASFVQRYSQCGKRQCSCRHGGPKHGPFFYLTQCLAVSKVNKFLLKTSAQQHAAKAGIEHYRQLQELLEELSQINTELLRREEPL